MKKIVKILFLCVFAIPLMVINVKASSVPYQWIVGNEKVNVGSPNQSGTATLDKDGKIVTLHLKNYNGGSLQLECYGTGQSDMTFIIDLEGNNKIEAENIGIDMGETNDKITFQGSGDLTIIATKPISYESYTNKAYINPSSNQYGEQKEEPSTSVEEEPLLISEKEETKEDLTTDTSEKVETVGEKKDNTLLYIFGAYAIISLLIIIGLIAKISKMEKNVTEE